MNFIQAPALLEVERREKEARIRRYLAERGIGALVLSRVENFAWLTGGRNNRIVTTEEAGAATLVYNADGTKYVITNVSEARRIQEEELASLGWEVRSTRWDQSTAYLLHAALNGRRAAADTVGWPGVQLADGFSRLRYQLTEAEVERLTWLARMTGQAVADACRAHQPGEPEYAAVTRLHAALAPHGITPAVVLAGSDDRVLRYRHPVCPRPSRSNDTSRSGGSPKSGASTLPPLGSFTLLPCPMSWSASSPLPLKWTWPT